MDALSATYGIVFFNVYTVCTLIPAIFFLVMAILLFSMKKKSVPTLIMGFMYFFMFTFFFGYVFGTSIDHPAAAYYRFIVVTSIFAACFSGTLLIHLYPPRGETRATGVLAVIAGIATVVIPAWYIIHHVTHGKPYFNFESHSWEFPVSAADMTVSLGVAAEIFLFMAAGLYRFIRGRAKPKWPLAAIVLSIALMTLVSSSMSALSKSGDISRGTFFLTQDFLDITAYFFVAVIYINATKDRSSFMTKIIGITLVTFLIVFQILSYIALKNEETSFHRVNVSAAETASRLQIMPAGMSYLQNIRVTAPQPFISMEGIGAERESFVRKCWAYDAICAGNAYAVPPVIEEVFRRAGPSALGYRAAVLSFVEKSRRELRTAELAPMIDRTGSKAERMMRRLSLCSKSELPGKAFELFRRYRDEETAPLYDAIEAYVTELGIRGEDSRTVIRSMLFPMLPSGSHRFADGPDATRFIEYAVALPDDSLVVAAYDYRSYRNFLSPMAEKYCIILAAVSLIILFGFRFFFFRAITHPLKLIEDGIEEARRGNRIVEVPVIVEDEIGLMARVFNGMMQRIAQSESNLEGKVAERTRQLESANGELVSTLELLRKTQADLIRREKMAALGDMVAGIAHEINTPVGVALTAGTFLSGRAAEVKALAEGDELSRSQFNSFISSLNESASIITSNLSRAAELINSFKKVAVAQTSGELSEFRLSQYINDLLVNLRPALRRAKVEAAVDCDGSLTVTTFPGSISQIFTNLIMNSITHAFGPDRQGRIGIAVRQEGNEIVFEYRDDGKGIPEEVLPKIFDPFFTTARGRGGTGLGLHIVYNIVTQKLGGKISVESDPGKGTAFFIRIPTLTR